MAGSVLDLDQIIVPDQLGTALAVQYTTWDSLKTVRINDWKMIQKYVYATDTNNTANNALPWKNKTTVPKLCQIRDNLYANYMAALFPKRQSVTWEGSAGKDQTASKKTAIEAYCQNMMEQPEFKEAVSRSILDYIDYGNPFLSLTWKDEQIAQDTGFKSGYVGPIPVRISPLDIVFNPIAPSFSQTPKIVRSVVTIGELANQLASFTSPEYAEETQKAFDYLKDVRKTVSQWNGGYKTKNELFAIAGFTSFDVYLRSSYIEILTFQGDYYDVYNDKMYKNYVIHVADRHKILGMRPNPSFLGKSSIFSTSWRMRPDNLWGMGPLDNLVGMQYRIDHVENLKADVFDLVAAPPLMIKGVVDDFQWGPFSKIYVGDDGDVKALAPDVNALQYNLEIENLQNTMEVMAGSPKEAAGFRSPGEKTMYEVQRLENAANRIFLTKVRQYEEQVLEPLLNAMLELARRKMDGATVVRVFNDETHAMDFMSITPEDLSGMGRIRPIAARVFAEKAERVQNMTNFYASAIGADPEIRAHMSTLALAEMFEDLLDIEPYNVVKPYIRIIEEQEAQKFVNAGQEQVALDAETPAGTSPDDVSIPTQPQVV